MCSYEHPDPEIKKQYVTELDALLVFRMRIHGMKGMYTYIGTVDDLDNFVANYINIYKQNTLIPVILTNMLIYHENK
jgi:hypothetical protein